MKNLFCIAVCMYLNHVNCSKTVLPFEVSIVPCSGGSVLLYPRSPKGEGVYCFTSVRLSVRPSVQGIFHHIFLSNCWWQKSDIWSQASYRYTILWEAFLDPSDSYFLFADLVGLYTHWTYMHIFRHIFLSNYWWQRSDIFSFADEIIWCTSYWLWLFFSLLKLIGLKGAIVIIW